jgi:hypothetical protein
MAIASLVAGCSNDGDRGLHLFISNMTDKAVLVTYEEPGHQMDLGRMEPGGFLDVQSVFEQRGPSCHGPFVARSPSGEEVARLDKACPTSDWRIVEPGSS